MIHARAHGERGFTLVELLVSLSILGLVAGMLLGGLGTAGLLAARGRQADAALDDVISAQALLRARLERLRPELRLDASVPIVDAQGTGTAFDFTAPPLGRDEPDALRRYRLALDHEGNLLLYSVSVVDPRATSDDPAARGVEPARLLRGVSTLSIRYYGTVAGGTRGWQTRWTPQPQLPEAIAIGLTFRRGDRRIWPDLEVRPRATVNATCRIDMATGRCGRAT